MAYTHYNLIFQYIIDNCSESQKIYELLQWEVIVNCHTSVSMLDEKHKMKLNTNGEYTDCRGRNQTYSFCVLSMQAGLLISTYRVLPILYRRYF